MNKVGQGKIGEGVPGQGCGGCACTLSTEMVDHKGESSKDGVINVNISVNRCCFLREIANNTPKGYWVPFFNDCNTIMKNAVKKCGANWDEAYQKYLSQNKEHDDFIDAFSAGFGECYPY